MKNLKLLFTIEEKLDVVNPAFISLNGDLIYITTNEQLYEYNLKNRNLKALVSVSGAVSTEFLTMNNEVSLATEIGEVLVYKVLSNKLEEVSFCEGGLEIMKWSQDQELVVFVTKQKTVVLMNSSFDVLSESNLTEDFFGENEFMNVGWGKKETQFHGTEGKIAATVTSNSEVLSLSSLSTKTNVTWRGDGELFAVSFRGSHGRCFKVFDREGILKCTSEKMNDLEYPISWRPSGSWIAVPRKQRNKSVIELFEKNGLKHREIILPFDISIDPIIDIKWNLESDILAIATETSIYLQIIGNYHWYTKHNLSYTNRIADFTFDNEENALHVILENGVYIFYKFSFDIDHSVGQSIENQGIVAVVDGKNLYLTDLRNNIIPPPMFKQKISIGEYINSCGFLRNASTVEEFSYFFTLQTNLVLNFHKCIFEQSDFNLRLVGVELFKTLKLDSYNSTPHNIVWLKKDLFCFCCYEPNFKTSIKFVNLEGVVEYTYLYDGIICTTNNIGYDLLALSTSYETIVIGPTKLNFRENQKEVCQKIQVFGDHVVTLRTNHHLYCAGKLIANNVSSFHITANFLAFTQFDFIKFVRLSDLQIVEERRMERGAQIVIIIPSTSKTVLQMPRGNLEGIHPRTLSLEIIGENINNLQYSEAITTMRKERINLNILCDHNIKLFMENIKTFVDNILKISYLNLFLSELKNEDFTKTMYAKNYSHRTSCEPFLKPSEKIDSICNQLCKYMTLNNSSKYILPIITTYVKTNQLDKALRIVWTERNREHSEEGERKSEEALTYLLYLVDVNDLFNVALGMYDFEITLFIASKSQKDPKEFLPFFNKLNSYEENYKKFKIDEYLKNYDKALENIAKCGEEKFEEALRFIEKNAKYTKALNVFKDQKECYKRVCLSFAEYLRSKGKLDGASIMYERSGDISQAILAAKSASNWRKCLYLCEEYERQQLSKSLLQSLEKAGNYQDAFEIHKRFFNDLKESIMFLIKGKLFLEAIYECRMSNIELLDSLLKPELVSYFKVLKEVLEADQKLFLKYKARLVVVRENRTKQSQEDNNEYITDEMEVLSDNTSMRSSIISGSSVKTGKTFRSSKNRRKHERKILSLKEGNQFEDIALIDALFNHITKVYAYQHHIRDTCKALLETNQDYEANIVQIMYKSILRLIEESLSEIWIEDLHENGPNDETEIVFSNLQDKQRYLLLDPLKRLKPKRNPIDWEHEILQL